MDSVVYIARAQLRHRWRSLAAITLFVGLVGGLAISLVAGARRSASVVDRFFAAAAPYDLFAVTPGLSRADLLALPGVVRADPSAYVALTGTEADGTRVATNGLMFDFAAVDPTFRLLEGRIPDGSDPSEILVNVGFVDQFGGGVGERTTLGTFGVDQLEAVSAGDYSRPTGPTFQFTIAGIVRSLQEIASDEIAAPGRSTHYDSSGAVLSETWYTAHHTEYLDFGSGYYVQLDERATSAGTFQAAVEARAPAGEGPEFGPPELTSRSGSLVSPVDLETTSLAALGIGISIAGLATVALLLRAEQRNFDGDASTLRALGCERRAIALISVAGNFPVALLGAASSGVVAVVLSDRFPIGIGRQLELDPGSNVDIAVVGLGIAIVALSVVGIAYAIGRLALGRTRRAPGFSSLSRSLAGIGAPPTAVLGTDFAFASSGGRSVARRRVAIVGGAAALAIVTAVTVFVGGVDRTYAIPARHGWAWDAVIGNSNFPLAADTAQRLAADPRVSGLTMAHAGTASIDGTNAFVFAIDPNGTAPPSVAAGRLPRTASEIALGAGLRADLDVDIGDSVTLSFGDEDFELDADAPTDVELTVVGAATLPAFADGDWGDDAVVTFAALAATGAKVEPQLAMVRLRTRDRTAAIAALDRELSEEMYTDLVPASVVNLHRVRGLPLLGLILAGAMGTIVLAFTLTTGVRTRLRDLAVLRALGMTSSRLRGVLTWQGLALAGSMVIIGMPLGFVAGATWWRSAARGLGVPGSPVVSSLLWLLLPLSGLVAIGASRYPAWRVRRRTGAAMLRSE